MCGLHFPTDCIAGYFLGEISMKLAGYISDKNLLISLLVIGFMTWEGGAKIISGALPILISDLNLHLAPIFFPLVFIKRPLGSFLQKFLPKGTSSVIISGLLAECGLLYLFTNCNSLLLKWRDQDIISSQIWTFMDPILNKLIRNPLI